MTTIILALKFLQDKTGFQFLSKQFPQKKFFRHSKTKKDPATEMAKIKDFLVGLGRSWVKNLFK